VDSRRAEDSPAGTRTVEAVDSQRGLKADIQSGPRANIPPAVAMDSPLGQQADIPPGPPAWVLQPGRPRTRPELNRPGSSRRPQ
jgi:hypothetical protein